jgi:hypothetical protein
MMAKQSGKKRVDKKDPEERARRKLAKAQLALQVAEEKHMQSRARGKQEVEKARLRAQRWHAKASQRVEALAALLTKAEDRLLSFTAPKVERPASNSGSKRGTEGSVAEVSSPEAAAQVLEQAEARKDADESSVIVPEGSVSPSEDRPANSDQTESRS